MRRILCSKLPKVGHKIGIDPTEAKHLTSVLRLKEGDEIELLDGAGQKCTATLSIEGKNCFAIGTSSPDSNQALNAKPVFLTLAMLKGEAMEWVIEKAVELGVHTIIPIQTDYTVLQIQKKGAEAFIERWQKIADQTLKQCGRLERLHIAMPTDIESSLTQNLSLTTYWFDETLALKPLAQKHFFAELETMIAKNITLSRPINLLIGPEGGFSPAERERLLQLTSLHKEEIKRVHLGSLILRAETAAIMAISLATGKTHGN